MDNQSYQADQITGNNLIKLKKLNIFFGFVIVLSKYFPNIVSYFDIREILKIIPSIDESFDRYVWLDKLFNEVTYNYLFVILGPYIVFSIVVYIFSKKLNINEKNISNKASQILFSIVNIHFIFSDLLRIIEICFINLFHYEINFKYIYKLSFFPYSVLVNTLAVIACSRFLIQSRMNSSTFTNDCINNKFSLFEKISVFIGLIFFIDNNILIYYLPNILPFIYVTSIKPPLLFILYKYAFIILVIAIIIKKLDIYDKLNREYLKINLFIFGSLATFIHYRLKGFLFITIYTTLNLYLLLIAKICLFVACVYLLIGMEPSPERGEESS